MTKLLAKKSRLFGHASIAFLSGKEARGKDTDQPGGPSWGILVSLGGSGISLGGLVAVAFPT